MTKILASNLSFFPLDIPSAYLQGIFYSKNRPQYMNYGSLGQIISHELIHGFDNTGRYFDKQGSIVDWWEPESKKEFTKRTQCMIDQYSNYTVKEVDMKVHKLTILTITE